MYIIGIVLCVAFFIQVGTASASTLSKPANNLGLIGYWSFDDGTSTIATDFSGNGNHGTITNMAAPATATSGWGNGKLGRGLNFDGTNDYVNLGGSASLTPTTEATYSAWIYVNSTNTNYGSIIVNYSGSNALYIGTDINQPSRIIVYFSGVNNFNITSVPLNKWVHLVITHNGSTVKGYIDGVQTNSASGTLVTGTGVTSVGMDVNRSNYPFNGKIDEVRIYNRALTQAQVTSLYNIGGQKLKTTPLNNNLGAYWSFNDGTSTSATDLSGNGKTGTLTNMASPGTAVSGWGQGKIGGGLNFDGSNDHVLTSFAPSGSSLSISAWVRMDAAGSYPMIVSYGQNSDSTVELRGSASTGKIEFINRATNGGATDSVSIVGTGWNHFVGIANGTQLKLYKNGVLVASSATAHNIIPVSGIPVAIGKRGEVANYYFKGAIDELRLYNRELSVAEITTLYGSGAQKINASQNTTKTSLDTGLVGMWSFNGTDISGTTAYDRSSSGNNGTLTNGPVVAIGKVGQALRFDGVDDYVSGTIAASATTYTVSGWIRYQGATPMSALQVAIGYGSGGGGSTLWMGFQSNGKLVISNSSVDMESVNVVNSKNWHHVVAVVSGGTLTGYVDGVLLGSQSMSTRLSDSLVVGSYTNQAFNFNGLADEVRVYNRALTASEARLLYDMGK